MYLVRVTPPMNLTFSDDSLFLKKILGGGHKFSQFACFSIFQHIRGKEKIKQKILLLHKMSEMCSMTW